jgi:hypothetical protein
MIPVKQAVQNAVGFANDLYPAGLVGRGWNEDVLLEEVEKGQSNGLDVWFVTLSIPGPGDPLGSVLNRGRVYKTFTVNGDSGEVLAMKIREFAGVS